MNLKKSATGEFEPIVQMQENNATNRESLPPIKIPRVLVVLFWGIILFVAALYYGIINP